MKRREWLSQVLCSRQNIVKFCLWVNLLLFDLLQTAEINQAAAERVRLSRSEGFYVSGKYILGFSGKKH